MLTVKINSWFFPKTLFSQNLQEMTVLLWLMWQVELTLEEPELYMPNGRGKTGQASQKHLVYTVAVQKYHMCPVASQKCLLYPIHLQKGLLYPLVVE
jgi:hypothetical protein